MDNKNKESIENQYKNINIPHFEDLYQEEAKKLLKMVNEQMEYYFDKSTKKNIDSFNIYQVINQIGKFKSNIPGIDNLKLNLVKDISKMAEHLESEISEKRKERALKIISMKNDIRTLEKRKHIMILKIIFFQWYLLSQYTQTEKEISNLHALINKLEKEEYLEKRAAFNEEQLIYIAHRFREKYLNIPLPDIDDKNLF